MARPYLLKENTFEGYNIQLDNNGSRIEILTAIVKIFHYMWVGRTRSLRKIIRDEKMTLTL